MTRPFNRRTTARTSAVLISLLLALLVLLPRLAAAQPNPVVAAWERARASGSYHFTSDILQTTAPTAKASNIGRSSHEDRLHLEGSTDLAADTINLRLRTDGASVTQQANAIDIQIADGKARMRQGSGPWREINNFTDTIAPHGDFMAYMAAVRDISAHEPETRAGITFTRYSFRLDGPAFATYIRDQMEQALAAKGSLPPRVRLEPPDQYARMTSQGELWVGADGLPLRQVLTLRFPEQHDETVSVYLTHDFSQFAPARATNGVNLQSLGAAASSGLPLSIGMLFAIVLVRFRRSRRLHVALSTLMISSLVLGPLLLNAKTRSFFEVQSAKAAAQDQQRNEADHERAVHAALVTPTFDPHANQATAAQPHRRARDTAGQRACRRAGSSQCAVCAAAAAGRGERWKNRQRRRWPDRLG